VAERSVFELGLLVPDACPALRRPKRDTTTESA
jgi:hypothetical protein